MKHLASRVAALALLTFAYPAQAQIQYYVDAYNGADNNEGTSPEKALRTLARAQVLVRRSAPSQSSDITVFLRGGRHALSETLRFGASDSGRNGHYIVYKAYETEQPVISGGIDLSRTWRDPDGDGILETNVPIGTRSRNLYISGKPATLARSDGPLPGVIISKDGLTTTDTALAKFRNPSQIEFVWPSDWKWKVFSAETITAEKDVSTVTMKQPGWSLRSGGMFSIEPDDPSRPNRAPDFIQNARELLDAPGEWYLDQVAGKLYYKPVAGVDMAHAESILAVVENELVRIEGTPENPVSRIRFEGLSFQHATYLRPQMAIGHAGQQSNATKSRAGSGNVSPTEATLRIVYADHIDFIGVDVRNSGAGGLFYGMGSKMSRVVGSTFTQIGSNGLQIGDFTRSINRDSDCVACERISEADAVRDIRIENNHIHRIGVEMRTASQAIHIGWTKNVLIAHNDIHDLGYTGIAMGYRWSDIPGDFGHNRITSNRIYDYLQAGRDGAGIYNLGFQGYGGNSLVDQNHIFLIHNEFAGIYPDEGSSYITWEKNLTENLGARRWLHDNSAGKAAQQKELIIRDNFTDTYQVRLTGSAAIVSPVFFSPGSRPAAAQIIAQTAGVEPAYRQLLHYRPVYQAEFSDTTTSIETRVSGFNGTGYVALGTASFNVDGGLGGEAKLQLRYRSSKTRFLTVNGKPVALRSKPDAWDVVTVPVRLNPGGNKLVMAANGGVWLDQVAIEDLIQKDGPDDLIPTAGALTRPSTLQTVSGWSDASRLIDGRTDTGLATTTSSEAAVEFTLTSVHEGFSLALTAPKGGMWGVSDWKVQVRETEEWTDIMPWMPLTHDDTQTFRAARETQKGSRLRLMVRNTTPGGHVGVTEFRATGRPVVSTKGAHP